MGGQLRPQAGRALGHAHNDQPTPRDPGTHDYTAVSRVKRIADHYGVAIALVHHVRKAGSDDFLAEVSGTNGIAGAADTVLVLKRTRGQADATLHVTGRDVDETEKALSFDRATGTWNLLDGPATDHTLHDTRAAILRQVRDHPGLSRPVITEGAELMATLFQSNTPERSG